MAKKYIINNIYLSFALSQYNSVLVNSYAEKSPALAAAALLRMEGLDFSRQFCSPAAESTTNDNIMVFIVQYVLEYKIGTWYQPGTGTGTPNFDCRPQPRPAPPHNDGTATQTQLLPENAPGLAPFLILNDLS